ncbi:hypothetical protein [Persicirhabdus sediminis]|uniref:Uncharacterized protein n=1 Tax=Persicirhabdus sediminis TaxID=454144 RepID=A0A8J7SKD0_9BACT|nr:hypothetical protein [Persicirhabdus sediminis]MBK1791651.1 hypothetical protein [Persicirhabdus sediminis]
MKISSSVILVVLIVLLYPVSQLMHITHGDAYIQQELSLVQQWSQNRINDSNYDMVKSVTVISLAGSWLILLLFRKIRGGSLKYKLPK